MSWTALTVTWSRRAEKDLRALDSKVARQIRDGVAAFAVTGQGDLKKLQDGSGYRLRIRTYRVLLDIDWSGRLMVVLAAPTRGDAY